MQSEQLIQTLIEQTRQVLNEVEKLKAQDFPALTWRSNPTSWNILECLEHLNRYGNFYLPEIERQINRSGTQSDREFKSGFLGAYFAKSMLPKEKLNKMKTFKDKNPLNANLGVDVIDRFISQQSQLLDLLDKSRHVSLNSVKTSISISKWIKIKLGDTFQFYVNHILRHLKQVERILFEYKQQTYTHSKHAVSVH